MLLDYEATTVFNFSRKLNQSVQMFNENRHGRATITVLNCLTISTEECVFISLQNIADILKRNFHKY